MKRNLIISLFLLTCLLGSLFFVTKARAQGGNQIISRDAIGLRVSPNPKHLAPLEWYNANIKIKGSPQTTTVDGYEAVRDGRTVYVNAAKIATVKRCSLSGVVCTSSADCGRIIIDPTVSFLKVIKTTLAAGIGSGGGGTCIPSSTPELYTNIYIISYNQEPETATTDIFGQLLQYWKFNSDIKNCSDNLNQLCKVDAECTGRLGTVCQPTGVCSQTNTKSCLLDSDCPSGEYCRNIKSSIIRDVKRLSDLRMMKDDLEEYNAAQGNYPKLSQGTYLKNRTISTWPSWRQTFRPALGGALPEDPINKLTDCVSVGRTNPYDPITCWDESQKKYSAMPDPLALPTNPPKYSYAYYYQYDSNENTFKLCAINESGFVLGRGIGSTLCQVNACATCTGRQCGTDGCGHSCGTCTGSQVCYRHKCVANGSIIQTED